MLERAEACDGIKGAKASTVDLPGILQVDLEPVTPARRKLC